MKNDKLKLNASCIPKAVISRDWQRLPTHPQLVQIMWFLCSIHLFYYYYEEWTSFKGCCIGIVWVEDNNRFSHIRTAELYNECVIAKLRLPQHHINITISYFLNNICVLIILCVYNKCKNKNWVCSHWKAPIVYVMWLWIWALTVLKWLKLPAVIRTPSRSAEHSCHIRSVVVCTLCTDRKTLLLLTAPLWSSNRFSAWPSGVHTPHLVQIQSRIAGVRCLANSLDHMSWKRK